MESEGHKHDADLIATVFQYARVLYYIILYYIILPSIMDTKSVEATNITYRRPVLMPWSTVLYRT